MTPLVAELNAAPQRRRRRSHIRQERITVPFLRRFPASSCDLELMLQLVNEEALFDKDPHLALTGT